MSSNAKEKYTAEPKVRANELNNVAETARELEKPKYTAVHLYDKLKQ